MFYSVGEIKRGMVIPGGEYPSDQDKYRTGSGSDRVLVRRNFCVPALYQVATLYMKGRSRFCIRRLTCKKVGPYANISLLRAYTLSSLQHYKHRDSYGARDVTQTVSLRTAHELSSTPQTNSSRYIKCAVKYDLENNLGEENENNFCPKPRVVAIA